MSMMVTKAVAWYFDLFVSLRLSDHVCCIPAGMSGGSGGAHFYLLKFGVFWWCRFCNSCTHCFGEVDLFDFVTLHSCLHRSGCDMLCTKSQRRLRMRHRMLVSCELGSVGSFSVKGD